MGGHPIRGSGQDLDIDVEEGDEELESSGRTRGSDLVVDISEELLQ